MSPAVRVRVPGKVNLALAVGPRRADGYHDLATVFHAVSLFDEVSITPAEPGSGLRVSVEGEGADLIASGPGNLAHRALAMLANRAGLPCDVDVAVRKAIPVAAGMAGGSADAAAALVAGAALWRVRADDVDLASLGAELGSDVPFALRGGTAVGTGRGERLTPVLSRGTFHWVLALSRTTLSTPAVYAELDRLREARGDAATPPAIADALMQALRDGDAHALGGALSNDLQDAALSLRPELARVLEAGNDLGALGSVVSGSGPTCAFLARDGEHALDLAASLTATPEIRSVRCATGPVPGARIIAD